MVKTDDKQEPLFDCRVVVDEKSGETWAEALCVFCGVALFTITKENVDKPVPSSVLAYAGLHVIFACSGKDRRKSP